jgi:hypothetical protein
VVNGVLICRVIILSLFITLFSISPPTLAADISVGIWRTTGFQEWAISFPPNGASALYYPQSSLYTMFNYENKLAHQTALRIEGGIASKMTAATGTDSDWDYTKSGGLWYYGDFTTSGTSSFINADFKKKLNENSELFYGYSYRSNNFRMNNGTYYITNYVQQQPPESMPDLNSTYDISYQGPHVGVATKTNISPNLAVVGSLSYTPATLVQGHGWWNLRQLDFYHIGLGQMWDGSVGISYMPQKNASLTAGYRYQYASLYTGTESTSTDVSWDKATNIQKGYFFSGNIRF